MLTPAAAIAAVLTLLPSAPAAHFDGVVMGKDRVKAHTEWSWSQAAWVDIPDCYLLKVGQGMNIFTDWICVSPAAYSAAGWYSRYTGPGVPYEGSRL